MTQPSTPPTVLVDRPVSRSAAETVYEALRARILSFDLPPDRVLGRAELAAQYRVSLTPVREALQALEQDGLVRIRPQSGTVVTRIDADALRQNHFLRISTETEVVRRMAEAPSEAALRRAQAIVDMQKALSADTRQMDLFSDLDRGFHRSLFEAVGVEEIHRMIVRRQGHLARCQRLELPFSGKMVSIVEAHQAVLDAIGQGDPQAAAEAMRRHLTGTITRLEGLREAHPDYFSPPSAG